jgi:hypothetical protein
MSTYIQLTRQEFEDWLDTLGLQWALKAPQTGGVYQIFLSPDVAIDINSTTGTRDQVMGAGKASMGLRLVSRHNGRVLNKKAMGQSHFARTLKWRDNWAKGVDRVRDAYIKAKGFYDTIAKYGDLEAYKDHVVAKIEAFPNWKANEFLVSLYDRVSQGIILTEKQQDALDNLNPRQAPAVENPLLPKLRELWRRAKSRDDNWTMDFAKSLGETLKYGRDLSPRQLSALEAKFDLYGLSE